MYNNNNTIVNLNITTIITMITTITSKETHFVLKPHNNIVLIKRKTLRSYYRIGQMDFHWEVVLASQH